MTPGMPAPPANVPLGPDGQPLDQGQSSPQVQGPPTKKFGFLGRLLGQKYQEEMYQQHEYAKHLMEQIDKASNDPNNRMPPEALDNYIKELSRIMGSEKMPAAEIKKKIQSGVDMKRAGHTLNQMQSNTQQPNMGNPTMPAAPASPPAQPPGIPKPPFEPGVAAGGPPPLQNEPPAMQEAAALGGSGDGIPAPPPMPSAPMPPVTVAPVAPQSRNRLSRAELGTEQGAQAGNLEVAKLRALTTYDQEAFVRGMTRLKSIVGEDGLKKLRPHQIFEFISTGKITPLAMVKNAEGETTTDPNTGEVYSGQPKPFSTAPGGKTTIPGIPGGVQPGQAWNPGNPMQNPPAAIGTPPNARAGDTTIEGGPLPLAPNQRAANAMWEAKHGLPIPPDQYGAAMSEYNEAAVTPSARNMQNQRIANFQEMRKVRQLNEAHLAQTIREFELTKGPAAIESLADQVHENPDLFQKLTGDVMNAVAQRFQQKYNLPAPRPLPADMKNKEDGSIISLNHVAAIGELLKNPVIQKRMGAWNGRVGDLEQTVGNTVGLTPADARAIQDFRTRISYLFAQEGKAVFGGRPPQTLMNDLKKSSPNMKMGLPLFQGALDAVKGMGELNIKSTDDYRFNRRSALPKPPGPAVGTVEDGHRFKGGDPSKPENWEVVKQ